MSAEIPRPGVRTACFAPQVQLWLGPDGAVRACCRILTELGNIADRRLLDIWNGPERQELIARLEDHDWSMGCENCGAEVAAEGWAGSYPEVFTPRAANFVDGTPPAWPDYIEFNLSNICNLQCIQCDGELSSEIRRHREHRPPLPKVYGEQFFEDLVAFLPHLKGAGFAGGEPFLAPETLRVLDLIAEVTPDLPCSIITNATRWDRRVERVLERNRVGFVFSLDGITAPTYESIRIGADFEQVMANVERFLAHARATGMPASVNHCLMPTNHHEFPDLLRWAEERGMTVAVSVVRQPLHCSMACLPPDELHAAVAAFEARDDEMERSLTLNLGTWRTELARLRAWLDGAAEEHALARYGATVLSFRCQGDGPCDAATARAELERAAGAAVATATVGIDEQLLTADPAIAAMTRTGPGELGSIRELAPRLQARFGTEGRYEVHRQGPDRIDASWDFGDRAVLVSMVALRDGSGWADRAAVLVVEVPAPQVTAWRDAEVADA